MKLRGLKFEAKGQDLIEYAVILAALVALAWLILSFTDGEGSISNVLKDIYQNAASLLAQFVEVFASPT